MPSESRRSYLPFALCAPILALFAACGTSDDSGGSSPLLSGLESAGGSSGSVASSRGAGGSHAGTAGASGGNPSSGGQSGASGQTSEGGQSPTGGTSAQGGSASSGGSSSSGGTMSQAGTSDQAGQAGTGGSDAGGSNANGGLGDGGSASSAGGDTSAGGAGEGGSAGGVTAITVCSQTATWGAGAPLAISTSMDDRSPAVTSDELTLAWMTGTDGSAVPHFADRPSTDDDYEAGALPALVMPLALDRPALSADGLRIGLVLASRLGFRELTRASKAESFTDAGDGTFLNLNQMGQAFPAGTSYGDPVIAPDDRTIFFSIYGGTDSRTIVFAQRLFPGDPWPTPTPLQGSALSAQGNLRRRPTGIASDLLTLFYFDQVSGMERAAFRNQTLGDFLVFVDVGAQTGATPNQACDALTYASAGPTSLDLYRAIKQ